MAWFGLGGFTNAQNQTKPNDIRSDLVFKLFDFFLLKTKPNQ